MNATEGGIRRVLVVDDERIIAESLALILSHSGFVTKTALNGEQAIETARVFLPDLVIADVCLGGITGIETANEILTFLPSCKVIMFSGQATTLDLLKRSRSAERFEIFSKPIPPDVLLQHISRLA